MTAKIIEKDALNKIIKGWMKSHDVIAPTASVEGLQLKRISNPEEITFDGVRKSVYPPKNIFLPQSEVLFKYEDGSYKEPKIARKKRIIFGVRPCDARALWLLDTIFNTAEDLDLYWGKKREKALVISLGCGTLCNSGFCDSVGSGPFGKDGSDIIITELEDVYYLKPLTEAGETFVSKLTNVNSSQTKQMKAIQKNSMVEGHVHADLPLIREKLYNAFDTPIWKDVSASCLGCGVCTYLCPTCFCFDIVDEIDRKERVRNWDTCMFRIYSQEASGHNPRPSKAERTRQRIMHKFAYWIDNENVSGCTGCGRCVAHCPVNLDIREMIKEITSQKIQ